MKKLNRKNAKMADKPTDDAERNMKIKDGNLRSRSSRQGKKVVAFFLSITMIFGAFLHVSAQECTNPNWEVYASGLTNPRNIHFGPDGLLYVAEAGIGGDLEPTCEPADNMFQP